MTALHLQHGMRTSKSVPPRRRALSIRLDMSSSLNTPLLFRYPARGDLGEYRKLFRIWRPSVKWPVTLKASRAVFLIFSFSSSGRRSFRIEMHSERVVGVGPSYPVISLSSTFGFGLFASMEGLYAR
jgi:hypothetical protein